MSLIVSVDPGKNGLGVAWFFLGKLQDARYHQRSEKEALRDFALRMMPREGWLVVELPQIYQKRAPRTNQNNLVDLAVIAGAVATAHPWRDVTMIWPHEWKGCVDKEVTKDRVLSRLHGYEKERIALLDTKASLHHNIYDAIGIGLWALKRREPLK